MSKADQRAAICAEVVRRLSEQRKRRGLSMNRIAAEAGLSQSMISRLESDPRNPTLDSLLRVADVLGMNLGTVIQQAFASIAEAAKPKARASPANKAKIASPKQIGPRSRKAR